MGLWLGLGLGAPCARPSLQCLLFESSSNRIAFDERSDSTLLYSEVLGGNYREEGAKYSNSFSVFRARFSSVQLGNYSHCVRFLFLFCEYLLYLLYFLFFCGFCVIIPCCSLLFGVARCWLLGLYKNQ